MHLLPRTRTGKWSLGLLILFFLLYGVFSFLAAFAQRNGTTVSGNPLLAIPGFAAGACAVAAFVTGVIAVFHREEKAVLVFVSLAVGLAVTLFLAGEFAFPH